MQTSLARRQARRLNGPRRGRGSAGRRAAVAIPVALFTAMAFVALLGFVGVVGVFAAYSVGLPDVKTLGTIDFTQESVIYDRSGSVELARFGAEQREVVTFDQIPPILIDATTAVEDKTFWTNTGVDPVGIASAAFDTLRGSERGASTITQQLVRQRLLDPELVQDPGRLIERKIKEIIQSVRVTEAYPGDEGKKAVITAYLNQNYYGNSSYGVKAAAEKYFGVTDLNELTLGQVALIAALPQSPSNYDLVRNAVDDGQGNLYVPLDPDNITIVWRRNYVLDLLANEPSRRVLTGNTYSAEQFEAAKNEPINLAPQETQRWRAPHFVWAVRAELASRLCGEAETCPALERGGLRIHTTLDWDIQQVAEKWVTAAVLLPHSEDPAAMADEIGVPYESWMKKLRKLEVNNGALVAIDYQTGEIIAYVGSAGYYRSDLTTPKFQPQFDVLAKGWRQPGSTFKPFNYVTGLNDRTMTPGTMFMDVTTRFQGGQGGYIPKDYDLLERGPVRMRTALQWSMNIPAVKALAINGVDRVFDMAGQFGMVFQQDSPRAGLSLTLGTEVVHPLDVAEAYATLANDGRYIGYTHILRVTDAAGSDVVDPYQPPVGQPAVTPQAAFLMTDILASNTDPNRNPIWGAFELQAENGKRRPATLKTGTNNEALDLTAFGYVAPPEQADREAGQYALVVGAWGGNSDNSAVLTPENPVFSTDVAAPVWHGFMQEVTGAWPIARFNQPPGIVEAEVDAWSGMKPGPYTRRTVTELFIEGTVPGQDTTKQGLQVITDDEGNEYLWSEGCPGTPEKKGFLVLDEVDKDHPDWQAADLDWIERAKKGPGTAGGPDKDVRTRTSYIFNQRNTPFGKSWGAPFPPEADCTEAPSPSPSPSPSPTLTEAPSPSPSPVPEPSPTPEPTAEPTPTPSPPPTPAPTPSLSLVPPPLDGEPPPPDE
jgi:membrane peptidoglycan carboxypeptidase